MAKQDKKQMSPLAVFFVLLALVALAAGGWFIYKHFFENRKGFAPEHFQKDENGRMSYTGNDPEAHPRFGIDVSEFQGVIDWDRVRADGVTFVYVRAGYRGYGNGKLKEDGMVRQNVTGARAVGLDVGVYFYSQAVSEAEGTEEAEFVLRTIEGLDVTLPIAIDLEELHEEEARTKNLSWDQRTLIAAAFSERILREGLTPMVYANRTAHETQLDPSYFPKAKIWYAYYSYPLKKRVSFDIWQYDQHGHVDGIEPEVDLDLMVTDLSLYR